MIKTIHLAAVHLSVLGFLLRAVWMLMDSGMLQKKPVKILPHIIDTVLLISALALWYDVYNFAFAEWIVAKWVGLIGYIVFGAIALKRGKTKPIRIGALVAALICIGLIFSAAYSKQPLPF